MERAILKFEWPRGQERLAVPYEGAICVLVAPQADPEWPTIWCDVRTAMPGVTEFVLRGTGHPVPKFTEEHVGSAVCGPFVWHVFQIVEPF